MSGHVREGAREDWCSNLRKHVRVAVGHLTSSSLDSSPPVEVEPIFYSLGCPGELLNKIHKYIIMFIIPSPKDKF